MLLVLLYFSRFCHCPDCSHRETLFLSVMLMSPALILKEVTGALPVAERRLGNKPENKPERTARERSSHKHRFVDLTNIMCASPMHPGGSPMHASPMYASPMHASPMHASRRSHANRPDCRPEP